MAWGRHGAVPRPCAPARGLPIRAVAVLERRRGALLRHAAAPPTVERGVYMAKEPASSAVRRTRRTHSRA
jgi:hypothetical protein